MSDGDDRVLDEVDCHGDRSGDAELAGKVLRVIAFKGPADGDSAAIGGGYQPSRSEWAAYAGEWWWPVPMVHDIGVKLPPDRAQALFPGLDITHYRR